MDRVRLRELAERKRGPAVVSTPHGYAITKEWAGEVVVNRWGGHSLRALAERSDDDQG